jgi:hypothetical protein
MIMSYSKECLDYIKECLAKEDRKPIGMYGTWAYYAAKKKEYEKNKCQD